MDCTVQHTEVQIFLENKYLLYLISYWLFLDRTVKHTEVQSLLENKYHSITFRAQKSPGLLFNYSC